MPDTLDDPAAPRRRRWQRCPSPSSRRRLLRALAVGAAMAVGVGGGVIGTAAPGVALDGPTAGRAPAPIPAPAPPATTPGAPGPAAVPPPTTAPDTLPADLAAVAAADPAQSLSPPADEADETDEDRVVPAAGVIAELASAPVSGPTVTEAERSRRAVQQDIDAVRTDQAAASAEVEELQRQRGDLEVDRTGLDAELAGHRQRQQAALADVDARRIQAEQVRDLLAELAADAYVGIGADPIRLDSPEITDGARRTTYRRNLFELKRTEWLDQLERQRAAQSLAEAAAGDAARVEGAVAEVEAARSANGNALAAAERRRQEAADREATLRVRLGQAETVLAEARRTANVVGLDMPLVVLDAIWSATRRMAAERPACHLRWNLLAAISRIESGHGRFGTSSVDRDGGVQPRIVGPALDGQLFALIRDTDGGRLDGDVVYDRAVGPMQFIPSSWALFGRDGNGDGRGDPNNYYDATLAAAEHLCRAGADTATEGGLRAAVLSYNPSEEYLRSVVGQALRYANFLPG